MAAGSIEISAEADENCLLIEVIEQGPGFKGVAAERDANRVGARCETGGPAEHRLAGATRPGSPPPLPERPAAPGRMSPAGRPAHPTT